MDAKNYNKRADDEMIEVGIASVEAVLIGKNGRKNCRWKDDDISRGNCIRRKNIINGKIEDAKNDAWLLLSMACKIDHTYYYVHMDEDLTVEQTKEYESLVKKERNEFHCNI